MTDVKTETTEVTVEEGICTAFSLAMREQVIAGKLDSELAKEIYAKATEFIDHLLAGDILELHNTDPIKAIPREDYQREDVDKDDNLIIGG